jgi:hypothetical protein
VPFGTGLHHHGRHVVRDDVMQLASDASAVVLALAQLTPVAFPAGMLMLLWFVAAGVSLARENE